MTEVPPPTTGPAEASPENRPEIRTVVLGPFQTNCYIVCPADPKPGDPCWVADVGFEPKPLLDEIDRLQLEPEAVVLTHAHLDHIAGLLAFRRRFPHTPIWIHEAEADWLNDPILNLSAGYGLEITGPTPDRLLRDGEVLALAGEEWTVLHTPGHSPGGISLVHKRSPTAIVGDTLFAGSIGRHDFPGSDFATLAKSIRGKLYTLPDDTIALPGHGPATQIGREKLTNPFVREDSVSV